MFPIAHHLLKRRHAGGDVAGVDGGRRGRRDVAPGRGICRGIGIVFLIATEIIATTN